MGDVAGWNQFDFFVTYCSLLDVCLSFLGWDPIALRALRVARILRLLRVSSEMIRFEVTVVQVWTAYCEHSLQ